jgi:hypothetical protein
MLLLLPLPPTHCGSFRRCRRRVLTAFIVMSTVLLIMPSYSFGFVRSTICTWTYTASPCTLRFSSSSSDGSNNIEDDVEYYRNQAEQLRNEIAQFEQQKSRDNELRQQEQNDILNQEKQLQDRYSAIVPILKPDGTTVMERCTFTPIYTDGTSFITTIESDLPLGIIIGEVTSTDTTNEENDTNTILQQRVPYIAIDEMSPNSNGEINGLQTGDIIHACTACKVDMELPTWQLLLGGIGRPKTNRYMHSVVSDGTLRSRSSSLLEQTMNAIASNRFDPEQRPILLVIERREQQNIDSS